MSRELHPERYGRNQKKRWQARVSRGGVSYYIGDFETKAEADKAERKFKEERGWLKPADHTVVRNGEEHFRKYTHERAPWGTHHRRKSCDT